HSSTCPSRDVEDAKQRPLRLGRSLRRRRYGYCCSRVGPGLPELSMGDSSQCPCCSICYSGGDCPLGGYFRSLQDSSGSEEELSETFRHRTDSAIWSLRVLASPGGFRLLWCLPFIRTHFNASKHCSSIGH